MTARKNMSRQSNRKHKKLRTALIITAAVVVAAAVFLWIFRVKRVYVEGNERYTDEQIRELALPEPVWRNSVIFTKLFGDIDTSDIPFVESIKAEYLDRNSIRLNVTETMMAGFFRTAGTDYYFDEDGRVLLELEEGADPGDPYVTQISGLNASNIGLGHVIEFEDPDVLYTIIALAQMIRQYGTVPDLIYFDPDMNIILYFGDVKVLLGKDELLEEKMIRMAAILKNLNEEKGTLHLENYTEETGNIIFDTNG